jgi:hypothetical protein
MSVDIEAWLQGLGLERYEPAFRANEIDAGVLPNLTADDLKDLGGSAIAGGSSTRLPRSAPRRRRFLRHRLPLTPNDGNSR